MIGFLSSVTGTPDKKGRIELFQGKFNECYCCLNLYVVAVKL